MLDQGKYAQSDPRSQRSIVVVSKGKGLHLLHVKVKLGILGPLHTELIAQVSILLDELCDAEATYRACKSVFVHTWTGIIQFNLSSPLPPSMTATRICGTILFTKRQLAISYARWTIENCLMSKLQRSDKAQVLPKAFAIESFRCAAAQ